MADNVKQAAKREPKASDKPNTEQTIDKAGPTYPMPNGEPRVERAPTPGS